MLTTTIDIAMVASGAAPTAGLRPGIVFLDTSLNQYMRWNGTGWTPVTLT